ncbi:PKD domain-containing protein [Rheinheimera riviphila]|uniref:PKD domain-containing protein n=1 Tax=Rheinheimera riviphila TaxID=1834037 RepID=A0A437QFX7_9GAMM|nr:M14 family zinc carboxypeptidase [Rheinheimera riviphila]RVU33334.1 PKD domain-containing protein [Rheinheimera riviphila]
MYKLSWLTSLLIGYPLYVAPFPDDPRLQDFQQQQLQQATEVRFATAELARAAAISHHDRLLAGHWKDKVLILQLDSKAKSQLAPFVISMESATQWQTAQAAAFSQLHNPSERSEANQAQAGISGFPCYETVEESYAIAEQLVRDYPDYASWQPIGPAWAKSNGRPGYDLYVLKLGKNNGMPNKPVLLINSAIHAREYATAPLMLAFAKSVLQGIGTNADADWILERQEIHLLLQSNPEGRKIAEGGLLWRKNINDLSCSAGNYGVDLNRNFSFGWNSVPGGSSGDSCDLTYRGVSAGSEPETQALQQYARAVFQDNRGPLRTDAAPATTPGIHLDIHSFSELVLWPWGENATPAPNGAALQTLGRKLAWFNDYLPTQAVGLYPTDGTTDGVSYGELGVAAYTFEIGTAFFQSCAVYQNQILPDNLKALWYAARVSAAPYLLPAGPEVQALTLNTVDGKVRQDQSLTLQFTLTDRQTNQQNGVEPNQPITKAELFINQFPTGAVAADVVLSAKDGAFDSAVELISGTLSGLPLGKHRLYLRGTDASGQAGPVYASYVEVTPAQEDPLISLDFSVQCQFLRCTFQNLSQVATGSNLAFSWQFGAGQSSQASATQFVFSAAGSYPVSLSTVSLGQPRLVTKTVTVFSEPQVSFSSSCSNLVCDLTASASSGNGAITQYNWQLGSAVASGNPLRFTFSGAGSYPVTLTVQDAAGQQASSSQTLTVTAPPPPPPAVTAEKSSGGSWPWVLSLSLGLLCWNRRQRRWCEMDRLR